MGEVKIQEEQTQETIVRRGGNAPRKVNANVDSIIDAFPLSVSLLISSFIALFFVLFPCPGTRVVETCFCRDLIVRNSFMRGSVVGTRS